MEAFYYAVAIVCLIMIGLVIWVMMPISPESESSLSGETFHHSNSCATNRSCDSNKMGVVCEFAPRFRCDTDDLTQMPNYYRSVERPWTMFEEMNYNLLPDELERSAVYKYEPPTSYVSPDMFMRKYGRINIAVDRYAKN